MWRRVVLREAFRSRCFAFSAAFGFVQRNFNIGKCAAECGDRFAQRVPYVSAIGAIPQRQSRFAVHRKCREQLDYRLSFQCARKHGPLYVIAGSNTGIDNPGQLSEDGQGNLYVANGSLFAPSVKPAILVFGHGANGNVPPIRKIAGPLAVHKIQAMTVDQATGEIYVFEGTAPHTEGRSILARFARNATGNVAPLARAYDLDPAVQLASDSSGTGVIEANQPQDYKDFFWGTSTYPAQFRNDSSPTAIYYVLAFFSRGIADDASTRTYLTSGEASFARCTRPSCGDTISGIYRFAEDTTGNFSYNGGPSSLTPPVLSIITSDTCGTQLAVAPGSSPNTYVTHSIKFGSCPTDGVYVYASNASGNAAPLRVLSGSATQLNEPYGIYEGK